MGWVADAIGRKPAILLSTAGMFLCSGLIGCLPSFTCCGATGGHVGMWLLIFLRTLQGLFQAGQVTASLVYTIERISPAYAAGAVGIVYACIR